MQTPPIPLLVKDITNGEQGNQNEWHSLLQSVPLFAEVPTFLSPAIPAYNPARMQIVTTYSPFRTGTLYFDEMGITIDGLVVQTLLPWQNSLIKIGGFLFAILVAYGSVGVVIIFIVTVGGKHLGVPVFWQILFEMTCLLYISGYAMIHAYFERQQVETKLFLSWESLAEIRVHPQAKYMALCYVPLAVARPQETFREYLALAKLDPNTVRKIEATIRHFAPNVVRTQFVRPAQITPFRIAVGALVVVVVCTILVGFLVYLIDHRIL